MERVRSRTDVKLIGKESQHQYQTSKPLFKRFEIFSEDLVGVELYKDTIRLNKPIYVGSAILDLSKRHMYIAFYEVLKKTFPEMNLIFSGWYLQSLEIPIDS